MNFSQILLFVSRASVFAVVGFILWSIYFIFIKKGNFKSKIFIFNSLFIAYLFALIQITVIRDYGNFLDFTSKTYDISTVVLIPFSTTLGTLQHGLWQFIYHLVGNIIWFIPFGFLLPLTNFSSKKSTNIKKILTSSVILSLLIEILQFIFNTGISDIDDIIINVLGAMLGYFFIKLILKGGK